MIPADPRTTEALALADDVASQMFSRFHGRVPFHDLHSVAREAAFESARRWDGRGVFPRFAVQRIRWRVLDALRQRRHLGPHSEGEGLRRMAGLATERTADAVGLELLEREAAAGAVTLEDLERAARDGGSGNGGEAPDANDPGAALRSLLGRAAASFAVDLDSAGVHRIPDPRVDVEREVDRMRVRRAVHALPPAERAVIERHGYRGETFDEIARNLGVPRSTVFATYGRGLETLRRSLGEPPAAGVEARSER